MEESVHSKKMQIWNGFPKIDKNLLIISFWEQDKVGTQEN